MPISYYLRINHLTDDPDDCRAFVRPSQTVELKYVIERMVQRGSTVTSSDILSVLEDFSSALELMMGEGLNVNTPFANFHTGIRGKFHTILDNFDSSRHQIIPSINAGKRLKGYFRNRLSTTKIETVNKSPNLLEFTDHASEEKNRVLTPGNMASIYGHHLKFDASENNQGIYFIDKDAIKTKAKVLGQNSPSLLMFNIPGELLPGKYTLEVRNESTGKFRYLLSVE